ncbi:MAG: hypothetical protein Q8O92_06265 [Candidatus Latescibacter sp.]|nr:hypothetical protein [Candidatus Latescibacter sp.]
MNKPKLPIHNLSERHPGLTAELGESYTQAARVCLDRHHISPTEFDIFNKGSNQVAVAEWSICDDRIRNAFANEIDTTEAGAYACALAAVELSRGLVAIRRAETKTGADYYIAQIDHKIEDLEECLRLEISGVDSGPESTINQRLREKIRQATAGSSNLPAVATVVGFKVRKVMIEDVEEK